MPVSELWKQSSKQEPSVQQQLSGNHTHGRDAGMNSPPLQRFSVLILHGGGTQDYFLGDYTSKNKLQTKSNELFTWGDLSEWLNSEDNRPFSSASVLTVTRPGHGPAVSWNKGHEDKESQINNTLIKSWSLTPYQSTGGAAGVSERVF